MSNLPEIPFEEPDSKKRTCWHLMLNSRFYTHISTILVIMEMDLIIDPDSHVICGFFQKSVCKNTAPVHFFRFLHCCSSSPRLNLSPPIGKPIIKSHMSILIWNQGTVPAHPPIFCSWKFPPQIFHCENGAQRPRKRMGKCSSSSTSRPQPLPNLSTHSGPFFLQENRPFSMEKKNVAIFKTKKNLKSDLKLLPRNPT